MGLFDLINGFNAVPNPAMAQAPTPFSQSPVAQAFRTVGNGLGSAYNYITNPGTPPADMAPTINQAQANFSAAPTTNPVGGSYSAPASPAPAPVNGGPSVPLPQPRPQMAPPAAVSDPMNIAPPWATQPNPASQGFGTQSGSAQSNMAGNGLIPRFVNSLRGATTPPPQTNNGQSFQPQQQQPSMGILPRMWGDISSLGKMFSGGGGGSNPFNTTGSLY